MQTSQEHFTTIVYARFGGQTECIMGNWKIENGLMGIALAFPPDIAKATRLHSLQSSKFAPLYFASSELIPVYFYLFSFYLSVIFFVVYLFLYLI